MQFCMHFHFRLYQIDKEKYKDEEKNNIVHTYIFCMSICHVIFYLASFSSITSPYYFSDNFYFFILLLFVSQFLVLFLLNVLPRCLCVHQHLCVYSPSSLRNALSASHFSQIDNVVFLSA